KKRWTQSIASSVQQILFFLKRLVISPFFRIFANNAFHVDFVVFTQFTDHFRRTAERKHAGWNDFSGRNQAARSDECTFSDFAYVETDGSHADECSFLNDASMQSRFMVDGHCVIQMQGVAMALMKHVKILDIDFIADNGWGDIAADNRVEPN